MKTPNKGTEQLSDCLWILKIRCEAKLNEKGLYILKLMSHQSDYLLLDFVFTILMVTSKHGGIRSNSLVTSITFNRDLSDGPVNWSQVRMGNLP